LCSRWIFNEEQTSTKKEDGKNASLQSVAGQIKKDDKCNEDIREELGHNWDEQISVQQ
jgi:hypothetical protein